MVDGPVEGGVEHLDVLVVGAGISGIAASHHLQRTSPGKTFAILESRDRLGGTWDLFRYPGVRSDSDMFTLSFSFKPWTGIDAIADASAIHAYLVDVAREYAIDCRIRFGHRLTRASWDSAKARWTVEVERSGESSVALTCNFLFMCSGYYNYAEAHAPSFPGEDLFAGQIIHPQFWPATLQARGKEVVVIGSGATAMTLLPALAPVAAHVVMLQRSPTYVVSRPRRARMVNLLRRVLPSELLSRLARLKFIARDTLFFATATRFPRLARKVLLGLLRREIGSAEVDANFSPTYKPWEQRLCLVPDGDLFDALRSGKASVLTDEVESFTASGLRLRSGRELPADIIVKATGLKMELMSGVRLEVDGRPVVLSETVAYKGCMYSGLPNLASSFGYSNASWTLKAELICVYVCRVLKYMEAHGHDYCVPRADGVSLVDAGPLNLSSGYVTRALAQMPRQGDALPWKTLHNYVLDSGLLRHGRVDDGWLVFGRASESALPADAGTTRPRWTETVTRPPTV